MFGFWRYIGYNKKLGLEYYAKIEYEPIYDLLRQASINTENQVMVLSDLIRQDCPENDRSIGAYIVFYQIGPIDHSTHVTGPVSQSSAESE